MSGQPFVLCVDDEPNILSALRRLFVYHGFSCRGTTSAGEALRILGDEPVDIVVSDMQMPEMNGTRLLERVRAERPRTRRVLLTGQADLSTTIDAINQGGVHRYLVKPWNDRELVSVIQREHEALRLEEEVEQLRRLTQQRNEALNALNAGLERLVAERTQALEASVASLSDANRRIQGGFLDALKVFSNLIELTEGASGHSRRVARLAHRLALRAAMAAGDAQDVMVAGLLHEIGRIGLRDETVPPLATDASPGYLRHAARSQLALTGIEQLRAAVTLIRGHHERFDGRGRPDGLAGQDIPLGARILTIAHDYDVLRHGLDGERARDEPASLAMLRRAARGRYDPGLVDLLAAMLADEQGASRAAVAERLLRPSALRPGMKIARDLLGRDGALLLSTGFVLDAVLIRQIARYEDSDGSELLVAVDGDEPAPVQQLRSSAMKV